jgi:hypothetical protein
MSLLYSEISKFIDSGNYCVTIPINYLSNFLTESGDIDISPDFQRGHVWTRKQSSKYIEFLLRNGQSSTDIYWNNPYWLTASTNFTTDLSDKLLLVDGKQRLLACCDYVNNILPAFGHYANEYEDKLGMAGPRLRVHINNLRFRKEVLQWYLDLNEGGVVHTKKELDKVRSMLLTC